MSDTKNELETLLEKAATEPAHRPAFFSALLEATVWVPGRAADGEQIVEDSALDLQHWEKDDGTSVIPFFTSLEALQQAVADEQAFVMMPARTLMAMTLGESLFLNPKLPSGKEFTPREISHLLGEEGSPLSTQTVLEGGEALLLSEVAEPPAQMVDSLTTLFKTLKTVKRAFLCSIKERADAPANLLIGIEAEGDIEAIIQTTGSVATDTLPGDEPIDICQVVEGEKGISHFMIAHITMKSAGAASCAILSRTASSDSGGSSPRCFFMLPVRGTKAGWQKLMQGGKDSRIGRHHVIEEKSRHAQCDNAVEERHIPAPGPAPLFAQQRT